MLVLRINKKRIFFTTSVIRIFLKYQQFGNNKSENGGVLLGQVDETGNKILVCRASIPSVSDKSSFTSFNRDKRRAQYIIEYEFYNSAGKNTYLGEWHSHPAKLAEPSAQDQSMIAKQFTENELRIDFILLCIVAQEQLFLGLFDGDTILSKTSPLSSKLIEGPQES